MYGIVAMRSGLVYLALFTTCIGASSISFDPPRNFTTACSICLEALFAGTSAITAPPCGHEFHSDCLLEWLGNSQTTCPMCRADVGAVLRAVSPKENRPKDFPLKAITLFLFCILIVTVSKLRAATTDYVPTMMFVTSMVALLFWLLILVIEGCRIPDDVDPLIELLHR